MPWLAHAVDLLHLISVKHHGCGCSLAPSLMWIIATAGMEIDRAKEVNRLLAIASRCPKTGNNSDEVSCVDGVTPTAARQGGLPNAFNNIKQLV